LTADGSWLEEHQSRYMVGDEAQVAINDPTAKRAVREEPKMPVQDLFVSREQ
jgi:hypothetical protein